MPFESYLVATLTIQQLQAAIVALCAAAVLILPVIAGVALLAISQYGKVKEAWGQVNAINGNISAHTKALLSQAEQAGEIKQQMGEVQGRITELANGHSTTQTTGA